MTAGTNQRKHFAELLLSLRLHGESDPIRKGKNGGFSHDIRQTNEILHDPDVKNIHKVKAYRDWLTEGQPCVFGKSAANKRQVYVCVLDEDEVLRMKSGDEDLKATIDDHRRVWKRYALHGLNSSFVIVICSAAIAKVKPCPELKELSRRLMELYLDTDVQDDEIVTEHEWVYLRKMTGGNEELLRFATLPNIFCAQGDKRWWHDHRTPGAIMITSNALGHYMHSIGGASGADSCGALRRAMMTIQGAHKNAGGLPGFTATALVARPEEEPSPLEGDKQLGHHSARVYTGWFHTDHLIPSAFFVDEKPPQQYPDLDLSYIHDASVLDHKALFAGEPTDWYTINNEIWKNPGTNLKRTFEFSASEKQDAKKWLKDQLKKRLC